MKSTRISLFVLFVLIGILGTTTPLGWAQGHSNPVVVRATRHAYAPPLSQMAPIPPETQPAFAEENEDERTTTYTPNPRGLVQDAALQASPAANTGSQVTSLSTTAGLDILGLGAGFSGYSIQAIVPDANGAVGPTQYVQIVNESFAVFNKSNGNLLYGPANGNTLWQALGGPCSTSPNLDEIAQFDKLANVWVIMMPVFTSPNYICVAVSTTSDATNSSWNLYAFPEPPNKICGCRMTPDYPKVGVWPDGYYITLDQGWNGNFEGTAACVVNRNAMLAGNAATMQCFQNIGTAYGSLLPADLDGTVPPPSGAPNYLLNFDGNDQSLDLWQFHVDWDTPSNSTLTGPANIPVAAFNEPCGETVTELNYTTGACIPQSGTSQGLDSYGDRLMYRLGYRNLGSYQSLYVNHTVQISTSSSQTGVRWYELQNSGSGFGLYQQGTYAPDSNYRWMGSMAMDKAGDIALGYSASSSGMSPSIRYTGRLIGDPLGTLESETDVLSSANVAHGSQTNTFRWGDYSGMAIDPTDDCTFWYTTEYQPNNGNNHWATRIASFSFPSCTSSAPTYTLTVNQSGSGTVTSTDGLINCSNGSGTCSAVYSAGSAATLNASPSSGWTFAGWSGPCTGGNPCSLVMNSNLTPTATYTTTNRWSVVNKASRAGNPLTSLTIPATHSGNMIAIALMFNGTTSVSGVSDNAGNTYVSAHARSTINQYSTEIWYAVNSKSGATVVIPTFAGSPNHVEMSEWEASGVATGAPDAVATSFGNVTSNNTVGPAVTTSQTGDFVLSVLLAGTASFSAISSGNDFTDDFTTNGNGWAHITDNAAGAGTHQASWYTTAPAGVYCASTVAFLP